MSRPAGTGALAVLAAAALVAGLLVRALLLPLPGFAGDLDQFVLWVHGIAIGGFGNAYDLNLSFPAVMAWIWGALAAVQPGFAVVTDASDPAIRALMKLPASAADLAIASAVGWWFRGRPWVALAAFAAVLLWPATWYVSAWWGQYESLYVLPAVLAVLAARSGRPGAVAVLVAVSLMTKPQALPFVVPFAAWFLATQGLRGTLRAAAIGLGTIVLLWLPFVAAGGPFEYLGNLRTYQDDIFNVLSLRAWNPWWIVQELFAGGAFVTDSVPIAGPLTLRLLGFGLAGLLALVVFVGVYRSPTPERLSLGLAAITLVAFLSLTTMHERYLYPAVVFLLLGATARSHVVALVALGAAFAVNLVVAVPPEGWTIPLARPLGIVGAVVISAAGIAVIRAVARPPLRPPRPT